jgi:uncharacterized membrane protein YGL010W
MNSFINQAQFYAANHQNPISRYINFVAILLLLFSMMVFFGFLHLIIPGVMDITLAGIATLALLGYYYFLNWRLALALTVILFVLIWLANLVSRHGPNNSSLWVFIITFVLGGILQLVVYLMEAKRPAWKDNLWQALITPMLLTAEFYFMAGYMQDLKQQIREDSVIEAVPPELDEKL